MEQFLLAVATSIVTGTLGLTLIIWLVKDSHEFNLLYTLLFSVLHNTLMTGAFVALGIGTVSAVFSFGIEGLFMSLLILMVLVVFLVWLLVRWFEFDFAVGFFVTLAAAFMQWAIWASSRRLLETLMGA